ncbi:sigma factor-like helix-turn-helix DNA-binding protein [Geomesophilobacter sediminis]|uniref:RNA polymerase sigma-70 region 4 domain-containing protein n=1 Tax=Geomesophilobacter sediminis TaxID=2798584 RepID=A0A8J7LW94_9BACT|nr:sigma factor-like helix-turn-helix DNA-binding protein [Geomesophilobacter sediminis]MBJ6726464.1 hypothetical protein [Geomesophilobacter sediminis]
MGLPAADLERLRATALFPEDQAETLWSTGVGYLIEAGLSDAAIAIILRVLGELSGWPDVTAASIVIENVSDATLYSDIRLDELSGFPVPAGTGGGEIATVAWEDLAAITEQTIIGTSGFTVAALKAIGELWRLRNLAGDLERAACAGFSAAAHGEFHHLFEAYLRIVFPEDSGPDASQSAVKKRDFGLMVARLGIADGRVWTLKELGRAVQVSRERVRQIESRMRSVLGDPARLRYLRYLWLWIDVLLATRGGVGTVSEIAAELQDRLGWTTLPSEEAFISSIVLSPRYEVVPGRPLELVLSTHRCLNCAEVRSALLEHVNRAPDGMLSLERAPEVMTRFCRERHCRESSWLVRFSAQFVRRIGDSTEGISRHGDFLAADLGENKKKGRISYLVEQILLRAGSSLHFKEVQRQIGQLVPGLQMSTSSAHSRVSGSSVLWGPGSFIHPDFVTVPETLCAEIEDDILERLTSHDLPFVLLNGGIFESYRDRLAARNVPSREALYSCMRRRGSATLSFPDYPYVRRQGDSTLPRIPEALEAYLLKRGKPIFRAELVNFALTILGVERTQLQNYAARIPNLIRTGGKKVVHVGNLGVKKSDLAPIIETLAEFTVSPVTAGQVYQRNFALCRQQGITTPLFLHSLIHHFHAGEFAVSPSRAGFRPPPPPRPPRPDRSKPGRKKGAHPVVTRRPLSLAAQVVRYVKDLAAPCTTRELLEFLRPKYRNIDNIYQLMKSRKKIVWYTLNAVVARQTLGWTDEKQATIEELTASYLKKRERDQPFELVSEIFPVLHHQLPAIPGEIPWTSVLLHSLLGSGSRYLALGVAKDVIVPTADPQVIATMNDIYLYVLRTRFHGTAAIAPFINVLRGMGLMKQRLPKFLLGKDPRVTIQGDEIQVVAAAGTPPSRAGVAVLPRSLQS